MTAVTTRATMVADSIAFVSWDSQISVWCKIDQTITGPEDHRTRVPQEQDQNSLGVHGSRSFCSADFDKFLSWCSPSFLDVYHIFLMLMKVLSDGYASSNTGHKRPWKDAGLFSIQA